MPKNGLSDCFREGFIFADFPSKFSPYFCTVLKFSPITKFLRNLRATTLMCELWSNSSQILNNLLLNIWEKCHFSENSVNFKLICFLLTFSPNFSI